MGENHYKSIKKYERIILSNVFFRVDSHTFLNMKKNLNTFFKLLFLTLFCGKIMSQ